MKKERMAGFMPAVALALLMLVGAVSCGDKKSASSEATSGVETEVVEEELAVNVDTADGIVAEDAVAEEVKKDEAPAASSSSEDWNKILDEYEKYCDKLATVAKQAQAGDVSAITEYASLLESAESLQKKLDNASSELTAAQAARLNKIAAKMAKSMM